MERKNTHPVSVVHLVFGLIFLGGAGAWILGAAGVIEAGSARWIMPLILIISGGAGLVAAVVRSMSRPRPEIDDYESVVPDS